MSIIYTTDPITEETRQLYQDLKMQIEAVDTLRNTLVRDTELGQSVRIKSNRGS